MGAIYEIITSADSIVIRLPRNGTDERSLIKLLDYLEFDSLRRRSAIGEDELETLSSEVKEAAWGRIVPLFETDDPQPTVRL